mmetsp:Transcript_84112/g.223287  ORF Transcript_84112/g.223287 Transcript_84112/m.223287 type:complete len:477 (-) Transcript_84112:99-1529(-)
MSMAPRDVRALVWQVVGIMLPVTGTYALEGFGYLIPLIAASHYNAKDEAEVARLVGALGLGSVALTCVAFVTRAGWTGGQDALVSQAFGKGDFDLARTHLHQCQIWMTLLCIGCTGILCFTGPVLQAFGVADAETARMAGEFVFGCLPGLWFDFQYDTLRKFLMNQGMPTPSLVVLAVAFPLHCLSCVVLMDLDWLSAMHSLGLAWTVKAVVSFLLIASYTSWKRPTPSCQMWWWPFHRAAMSPHGLMVFARLGLPSMAMYGCDWIAWEVLTLLAGGLQDGPELAAHVAAAQASEWLFMVMRGTPKAATVLVGAAVGRGDAKGMLAVISACSWCCALLCSGTVLTMWLGRQHVVTWLLPIEGPAQTSLSSLLPMIAMQLVFDTANSLCQGVLAGLGKQGVACIGMFLSCWVVQLPAAYALAYHYGRGVRGLRTAGCCAGALSLLYNSGLMRSCLRPLCARDESASHVSHYAAMRGS